MAECAVGVCQPERTQGLQAQPAQGGSFKLVVLDGPGVFLGGHVTKQGGNSDITFVSLDIDGRNVVNVSYAAARTWGLTHQNPYGVVVVSTSGTLDTLAFGWPTPLRFEKSLVVSVTVNEVGVAQVLANVIHGQAS